MRFLLKTPFNKLRLFTAVDALRLDIVLTYCLSHERKPRSVLIHSFCQLGCSQPRTSRSEQQGAIQLVSLPSTTVSMLITRQINWFLFSTLYLNPHGASLLFSGAEVADQQELVWSHVLFCPEEAESRVILGFVLNHGEWLTYRPEEVKKKKFKYERTIFGIN